MTTHWRAVTLDQPAPLDDVLVSVYHPGDVEPCVYQAYRRRREWAHGDAWIISGTSAEELTHVYAWAPAPAAAPIPKTQADAA